MAKYIPLDAVLAEIDKVMAEEMKFYETACKEGDEEVSSSPMVYTRLQMLRSTIDTIEVKEVDLDDAKKEELAQEYVDYTFRRHNIDANSKEGQLIYYAYMHGMNQCLNQLKAQKGE